MDTKAALLVVGTFIAIAAKAEKPLPRFDLYPVCPCYVECGSSETEVNLDASVREGHPGDQLVIGISGPGIPRTEVVTISISAGGLVHSKAKIPSINPAVYQVAARFLDASGKELSKAHTDIHVVPPGRSKVTVEPDGFLRVAGKREFPIGLYSAAKYEEIGRAGFTVTHNYEITTGPADALINPNDMRLKELLDRSWVNGMRMMVELPRHAIERQNWPQVIHRIATFRHHPGLLCWDSEERVARGMAKAQNIEALYRLVHSWDPDHPFILGDSRDAIKKLQKDRRHFFADEAMDVGIWWWYPISPKSLQQPLTPPSWLTTAETKKPLWIAIQAYQTPRKASRYPTPVEYRDMAYLSMINGVKGIFFYTGSGEHDYLGHAAGLLNQPENSHWDYVQKLLRELHEITPVAMAPNAVDRLTISPKGGPVEMTAREYHGHLYILAANTARAPQTAEFHADAIKGRTVECLWEDRRLKTDGDGFKDRFEALAVHVYRLE